MQERYESPHLDSADINSQYSSLHDTIDFIFGSVLVQVGFYVLKLSNSTSFNSHSTVLILQTWRYLHSKSINLFIVNIVDTKGLLISTFISQIVVDPAKFYT